MSRPPSVTFRVVKLKDAYLLQVARTKPLWEQRPAGGTEAAVPHAAGFSLCTWKPTRSKGKASRASLFRRLSAFSCHTSHFSIKLQDLNGSLVPRVYKWHSFSFCLFWLSFAVLFLYIAECSACISFLFNMPNGHSRSFPQPQLSSPDNTHVLSLKVF